MKNKNVAIVAPLNNAYSETFINAHKRKLNYNIFYYYDGVPPRKMEGKGTIKQPLIYELIGRAVNKVPGKFKNIFGRRFEYSLVKEKIEVVLAEYGTTAVPILSSCRKLRIPLIVHFHGGDATVHQVIRDNRNAYKEVFEYASFIIVVSEVMKQKLLELGAPEDRLVLNTYGPNDIFSDVRPQFKSNVFFGIGRFVDKKAPYYTILAFYEMVKQHCEATLKLAGDGPLLNACKNLVKYLKIEKNVEFLGVISPQRLKEELENSLSFVQHSITADNGDMEGTPLAILEASLAGIPVISTIHAGIQDVVLHEETGLLVDEHDVHGMSKYMEQVLLDKGFARRLGESGRKRVREHFNLEKHLKKIEDLIDRVIESN